MINTNILKEKIIRPEDFFASVAKELTNKLNFKGFYFLMPKGESKFFITRYTTKEGRRVRFNRQELELLNISGQDITFTKDMFKKEKNSIIKNILRAKIRWKLRFYEIYAVVPIYFEGKIICLILFCNTSEKKHFYKKYKYIKKIRLEIQSIFVSILHYNRAISRIIKK